MPIEPDKEIDAIAAPPAQVANYSGPERRREPPGGHAELEVEAVADHVKKIKRLMRSLLDRDIHYGTIPGTGDRPSLLKPGAEKLCLMFNIYPKFETTREDGPGEHRTYDVTCSLYHKSGAAVGQGLGLCSTLESKYRYRKSERVCPTCGASAVIAGAERYGGGWLCWRKRDGCGATFLRDDEAITSQPTGRRENPDLPDSWNTVKKMAKKRAYVDATLSATAASDLFTQDVEDLAVGAPRPRDVTPRPPSAGAATKSSEAFVAAGTRLRAVFDHADLFTDAENDDTRRRLRELRDADPDDTTAPMALVSSWETELAKRQNLAASVPPYDDLPFGDEADQPANSGADQFRIGDGP